MIDKTQHKYLRP